MEKKIQLVRTRFAPSPTGELHVGGARTILFNYLFACRNNGQFVLRIEDTDIARNQEAFIQKQYEDLCWLGLKPNESIFKEGSFGPYRQSQRLEIYQNYIAKLLSEKKAYYCFCSAAELTQEREKYIQENQRSNYQYSRKCLQLSEKENKSFLQNKKEYLIRFLVNQQKSYEFLDLVRGKVIFQGYDIEDFVICRSNGIPLLNFAVVIDDYLMKISHVLRGEEHLSNTAKQLTLYEALNWEPPRFAHLSLILNKEKKKLSKRDKETSQFQLISQLRDLGYLPSAINNYLLFLGWHPGPGINQEFFTIEEAIQMFSLTGLHAKGAVYDLEKLNWYNNRYIQKLTESEFSEYAWQFLGQKRLLGPEKKEWIKEITLLFRPRLNYFQELENLTVYFFYPPKPKLSLNELEKNWLEAIKTEIKQLDKWEIEKIKDVLELTSKSKQVPKGKFFLLIRKMLMGQEKGPELLSIIYLLGKAEVLSRF